MTGATLKDRKMNDQQIEQEIQAKGLTAPRVTPQQIGALMARVQYTGGRIGETTSTVVHAFLDGNFLLASGPWVEVRDGNLTAAALYDRHAPGLAGRGREQPREVGLPRTAHGAVSHWSQEVNALNAIPVIGWVIAQGSAKRGEEQWPL